MAKTRKAKMIKSPDGNKLAIVNPDAAGIDIADTEMQVCVPEDRDGENNRRFGSFTCDLNMIVDWLKASCGQSSFHNLQCHTFNWIMSPLEVRLSCLPTAKVSISIENGNFTFAACRKRIGSLGFIPASWVMYFHTSIKDI